MKQCTVGAEYSPGIGWQYTLTTDDVFTGHYGSYETESAAVRMGLAHATAVVAENPPAVARRNFTSVLVDRLEHDAQAAALTTGGEAVMQLTYPSCARVIYAAMGGATLRARLGSPTLLDGGNGLVIRLPQPRAGGVVRIRVTLCAGSVYTIEGYRRNGLVVWTFTSVSAADLWARLACAGDGMSCVACRGLANTSQPCATCKRGMGLAPLLTAADQRRLDTDALVLAVARLNPEAGRVGAGTLAELVSRARRINPMWWSE